MSSPIDLTTLAAVKAYLVYPAATSDDVLSKLITAASQYVMTYCGRDFKTATYTENYDGTGNDRQLLRQVPVTAVASVSVNGQPWAAAVWGQNGYQFNEYGLIAMGSSLFVRGTRNVSVTYTAGYAVVPADLDQAVVEMVADKFKRRDWIGIQAKAIANETISYTSGDVPKSAQPVLDMYQRAAFGL